MVVTTGKLISARSQDGIPTRTKQFFHKLDANKDGKVTLDELQAGFEKEFKSGLMLHAKEAILTLFEEHAKAEEGAAGFFGAKALRAGSFNRFYAEILFKHFDANENGHLELAEAQEALKFLCRTKKDGAKPNLNVVYPNDAYTESGELRLPRSWFFQMYQAME